MVFPGRRIEHIAEDSKGFLWFASWDNGASRFDGEEFRKFTTLDGLASDCVHVIYEDSQKRLWFGTFGGVCWYDGADFHHLEDEGIAGRAVQFIYEDREGRTWFGGQGTLGYFDGARFHDLIPLYLRHYKRPPACHLNEQCRGIAQDPEGRLWFGFDYLIRFDGTSFCRYGKEEGFPNGPVSYAVGQDPAGRVWVGRRRHLNGLRCYANGTFQPFLLEFCGALRRIQSDREGRMWFSSAEGVFYQDGEGFSRFTTADGLPHPAVKAVFQDREHQFWFATWNGVGLYDAHSVSVFDFSAELRERASEISRMVLDSRGDIWIGIISPVFDARTRSVFRFDGERIEYVSAEQGDDINNCFAIYEDHDGRLWFCGRRGLFRYEGKELKRIETIEGVGKKQCQLSHPGSRRTIPLCLLGRGHKRREGLFQECSLCQPFEAHLPAGGAIPNYFCG